MGSVSACGTLYRKNAVASRMRLHNSWSVWLLVQFEKSNNKPVVVGYTIGAVAAFFTAEWLIHLPGKIL